MRASDVEHEEIERLLKNLQSFVDVTANTSARLYSVESLSADTVLEALDPKLIEQVNVKQLADQLWIRATSEQHESLKIAIEEIKSQLPMALSRSDKVARVYPFQNASPQSAQKLLAQQFPNAILVADEDAKTLAATASEVEQQQIQELVGELENRSTDDEQQISKVFRLRHVDPTTIAKAVSSLYRNQGTRAFPSESGQQLVVVAPQREQESIQQLVDQMDESDVTDTATSIRVYPIGEVDGDAAVESLQNLFEGQSPVINLRFESQGSRLIAVATPQQHGTIRSVLDQLKPAPRKFEVFTLAVVDPYTAQSAIEQLFGDLSSDASPSTDADLDTQRLFVRATEVQLVQIRELLAKMGESSLQDDESSSLRIIPFSGNSRKALEQLREIWPRLRSNELQIIEPSGTSPQPPTSDPRAATSQPSSPIVQSGRARLPTGSQPHDINSGNINAIFVSTQAKSVSDSLEDTAEKNQVDSPSDRTPVVVIPSIDSITITSKDPEALGQRPV